MKVFFFFCELNSNFHFELYVLFCYSIYQLIYLPIYFIGDGIAYSVGANFTPHILTVNDGEVFCSFLLSLYSENSQII